MGKISDKVSNGLGTAIAEVKAKLNENINEENATEELLNSGVKAQKKRKKEKEIDDNSLFKTFEPKEEPRPKTHEEFCELQLKKAHERGLPDPDFDFRNHYEQGEIVYYVRYSELLGTKEIHKVYLRTIDPRMMVGSQEKSYCHCIGYNQRNQVFRTPKEADSFYKSLKIEPKYGSEKPKKQKDYDEDEDE